MITQQLLDFVKSEKEKGVSDIAITETLRKNGWNSEDIEQALTSSSRGMPKWVKILISIPAFLGIIAIAGILGMTTFVTIWPPKPRVISPTLLTPTISQAAMGSGSAVIHINGIQRPPGFSPSFRTIYVNTPVTFINDSYPPAPYTIVAKDGSFTSPALVPSQQWTVTLKTIGNHEYMTQEAPTKMVGDLIVVDVSDTLIPTPDPQKEQNLINEIKKQYQMNSIVSPTPAY